MLPDNWGPKAAARMKLNGEIELEAKKDRRERKRGTTKSQESDLNEGRLTKRARIRENKRLKRLRKKEVGDTETEVGNLSNKNIGTVEKS